MLVQILQEAVTKIELNKQEVYEGNSCVRGLEGGCLVRGGGPGPEASLTLSAGERGGDSGESPACPVA